MKRSLVYNEDNKPATELQVLLLKDKYEIYPIIADSKLFDVSLMIMKRFEMAIEFWNDLPKTNGYFPWMLEDSSIHLFTQQGLIDTFAIFRRKVTLRSADLHIKAQEILDLQMIYKDAKAEFQTIVDYWDLQP